MADPGVVHENVQPGRVIGMDRGRGRAALRFVGDVERDEAARPPIFRDAGRDALAVLDVAVGDEDQRARARQRVRNRLADPRRGAGHERDLSTEIKHRGCLPRF
jgi:hypothetical protein